MNSRPILHLIFDDKFIDRAIDLFERASPEQHHFLLDKPSKSYQLKYIRRNLDKIDIEVRGSKDYFEKLNSYKPELVVIHSLNYFHAHLINTFFTNTKVIWIFWGAEVYDYLREFRNQNFRRNTKKIAFRYILKNNVRNLLRPVFFRLKNPHVSWNFSKYKAFKKIDGLALAHRNEFDLLKNSLDLACTLHWFTYYSIEYLISKELMSTKVNGNNILIGNSATPSNNHLDILKQLKTDIKIRDRKLVIPLSYGLPWYKDKIIQIGKELFPNNLHTLTHFMPLLEYNQVVLNCNVVIMGHIRQQAVGNLIVSFWIGSLVFLDERNPLYNYFSDLGLIIFSIQKDLKLIEDNKILTDKEIQTQRSILLTYYREDKVVEKTSEMIASYL
jgi:hypothetical protein